MGINANLNAANDEKRQEEALERTGIKNKFRGCVEDDEFGRENKAKAKPKAHMEQKAHIFEKLNANFNDLDEKDRSKKTKNTSNEEKLLDTIFKINNWQDDHKEQYTETMNALKSNRKINDSIHTLMVSGKSVKHNTKINKPFNYNY